MNDSVTKVVIIGGGITGLVATHELAQAGNKVTLVEAEAQLGGQGTFFRNGDNWIDKFYHCQMPSDDYLLKLISDVGLKDQMYWKPTHMGFIFDGIRYPFNTPLDVLNFKPLSFIQRLRFGIVSLFIRRIGKGLDLDNIRIEDWFGKLYSKEVWDRILKPLFCSKFGAHGANLPALYIWQRLGRESNVAKRGYIHGGMKSLIDSIESKIKAFGGTVLTQSPVKKINEQNDKMVVTLDDEKSIECDWAISTLAIPLLKQTIIGETLEQKFRDPNLPYISVVNALFLLSRPLDKFYWSPVVNSGTEFDGIVEMSELVEKSQYNGRHAVYVMKYCDRDSELFNEDEDHIGQKWSDQLVSLYSDIKLKNEDIEETHVFKSPFIEPIYKPGYSKIKPDLRVGDSRLLLATTAQIYPDITSCNTCVKLANETVSFLRNIDRSVK